MKLFDFFKHELGVVKHDAYLLEYDPKTQWNFHRKAAWFWVIALLPTLVVMIFDILAAFGTFSGFIALILTALMLAWNTVCSIYANIATELDAISAAYAAMKSDETAKSLEQK